MHCPGVRGQVINYAHNGERAQALLHELEGIAISNSDNNSDNNNNKSQSPRFHAVRADVGDRPAVQRLVDETLATMGRLDVVVSNAGWTRMTNFLDLEDGAVDADWDRCFTYNVKTHVWLAHAAKPPG